MGQTESQREASAQVWENSAAEGTAREKQRARSNDRWGETVEESVLALSHLHLRRCSASARAVASSRVPTWVTLLVVFGCCRQQEQCDARRNAHSEWGAIRGLIKTVVKINKNKAKRKQNLQVSKGEAR